MLHPFYRLSSGPGPMPISNRGPVRITLSAASASCLSKVPDVEAWIVAPTMVRGSKTVLEDDALPSAKKTKAKKAFAVRGAAAFAAKRASAKTKKNKKKRKEVEQKVKFGKDDPRRFQKSIEGRGYIQDSLQEVFNADYKAFSPRAPCFDSDGVCMMTHASAKGKTWQEIWVGDCGYPATVA